MVTKEIIKEYMPSDFASKYPDTRCILDATECFIEKPSQVREQAATWSNYKNPNTIKTMIGISPRGQVIYISDTYGGHTSDRQNIERSALLQENKFEKKDSIMTDRGIMVQDLFACKDVSVNTPTMLKGRKQSAPDTVIKDTPLFSGRIVFVCFMICNFRPCIVNSHC